MRKVRKVREMEDTYQVYLDLVKDYLKTTGKRPLTEKEEEIVVAHLKVVSATYCLKHSIKRNDAGEGSSIAQELAEYGKTCARTDADVYKGLGITQVLSIETAKKVSEIHPDFPAPTQEQVDQRVAEVLAVQNFLYEGVSK